MSRLKSLKLATCAVLQIARGSVIRPTRPVRSTFSPKCRPIYTVLCALVVLLGSESLFAAPILLGARTSGYGGGSSSDYSDIGWLEISFSAPGGPCIGCGALIPFSGSSAPATIIRTYDSSTSPEFSNLMSRFTDSVAETHQVSYRFLRNDQTIAAGIGGGIFDLGNFPTATTWNVSHVTLNMNRIKVGPKLPECQGQVCTNPGLRFSFSRTLQFWGSGTPGLIEKIPEPETYVLMLTGLGIMGWVVSRKKRQQAAV